VNILGDPVSPPPESSTPRLNSLGLVDLVVNGSVIETKLSLYGKVKHYINFGNFSQMRPIILKKHLTFILITVFPHLSHYRSWTERAVIRKSF
jgi:hypothetical protein